jgi:hypothetical protein
MIQFYDDRPTDPLAAFVYFESVFRRQFLIGGHLSKEKMHNYASRLLIAKRELELSILPEWNLPLGENAKDTIEGFSKEMFERFQRDVISILPELIAYRFR